ncbi:MAG: DNA translocase FtsK 4TM domain-containing protein [Defluviicoccus sp.]|nr:DNA translocase FtsK 4TM domain-containing protein [Defluviicoccus sp.]MDG4607863.1 DNA translocase FtsK 4TM domain-containing protein [Defluviicoccus sp.]
MSASGSLALLPVGMADYLRRRVLEAAGVGTLFVAVALMLALLTFSPTDPSFNHATDSVPANLFGTAGAYTADLLLHGFGLACAVPALGLASWGWRLLCKQPVRRLGLRVLALTLGLFGLSIGFALLPAPAGWPISTSAGGGIGEALLNWFALLAGGTGGLLSRSGVALVAFGLGGALALYGMTFRWSEWLALARDARAATRAVVAFGRTAHALVTDPRRRAGLFRRQRQEIAGGQRRKPDIVGPTIADTVASASVRDLVAARRTKPRGGRKGEGESQGTLDFTQNPPYRGPSLDLLHEPLAMNGSLDEGAFKNGLEQNARMLATVLDDFGVRGDIVKVRPGPVVALYELEPAPGTKSARVIGLADDIARSMSAVSARVAVVPGRNVIGIELPNQRRETVALRELLASEAFERYAGTLTLALGKDIGGAPVFVDLARMPHLLIAGTTGSGKSVAINAMILSLLYRLSPEVCRFILIDPKMLELSVYDGIPHLLCPVVTEPGRAVVALKWTVREMEERYRAMSQLGVRNIAGYNARVLEAKRKGEEIIRRVQTGFDSDGRPVFEDQPLDLEPLPLIVVVVDEMADLMLVAGKDIEAAVQRLAQMARAAGIHLIMATQRPSVDVITGTIKANFPTRISFQVTSKIDSRTILGEQGGEQLLGHGDMLFMAGGGRISRVHGPFVSDSEVEAVVQHLKSQGDPSYLPEITDLGDAEPADAIDSDDAGTSDALYDEAVAIVSREGKASTSFIQRRLQIGYNRAARLMERMEQEGLVSKPDRVGRREVLIGDRNS